MAAEGGLERREEGGRGSGIGSVIRPREGTMRVGERAAVCCVTVYVRVRMACLVWPIPAVTVTSSLPRLHFRNLPDIRLEKSGLKSPSK